LIERLKGHQDSVYSVSFTRDGRFLVSASLDKSVRVWDVGHLGIVPVPGSPQQLQEAGTSVVPPSPTTTRSLKTRCVTQFVGHRDFVLSVAVSHDGKWVVSGSKDRGVMWWELGAAGETGGDEKGVRGKDSEEGKIRRRCVCCRGIRIV
jgi:glucose repression regulatory protein TUP1